MKIYTVTMFDKIEEDEITKKPTFGDRRCVGYYASIVDALDYITSINESTYKYCIIEAINDGVFKYSDERYLFEFNNNKFNQIDEPELLHQVTNFGIG